MSPTVSFGNQYSNSEQSQLGSAGATVAVVGNRPGRFLPFPAGKRSLFGDAISKLLTSSDGKCDEKFQAENCVRGSTERVARAYSALVEPHMQLLVIT